MQNPLCEECNYSEVEFKDELVALTACIIYQYIRVEATN